MESPKKQELDNTIFGIASIVVFYCLLSLILSLFDWMFGSNFLSQPLPVSFLNHDKTLPPLVWLCIWVLPLILLLSLRQTLVISNRRKVTRLKQKFVVEEREREACRR